MCAKSQPIPIPPTTLSFLSIGYRTSCTVQLSVLARPLGFETSEKYLVEERHRLIGTTNLNLKECGFTAIAIGCWTLHQLLLCVVPSARPSEDVVFLLTWEILAREDGCFDRMFIGAGPALQAITPSFHAREDEEICAVGADLNTCLAWLILMFEGNSQRMGMMNDTCAP